MRLVNNNGEIVNLGYYATPVLDDGFDRDVVRRWRIYYSSISMCVVDTYGRNVYYIEDRMQGIDYDNTSRLPVSIKERVFKIMRERWLIDVAVCSISRDRSSMSDRTFGIEMECMFPSVLGSYDDVCAKITEMGVNITYVGYTHRVLPSWKMVTDASLSPKAHYTTCEIVSPILSGSEGLAEINKMCMILNDLGFTVNVSCGLHVHHNARDLSLQQRTQVFELYRKKETLIDTIVSPSRRENNNRYCRSLVGGRGLPDSRYYKVNPMSYSKYGTIEFRQHQGTINYQKISNWIRLTQRITESPLMGISNYGTSLNDLLHSLALDLYVDFFNQRVMEL